MQSSYLAWRFELSNCHGCAEDFQVIGRLEFVGEGLVGIAIGLFRWLWLRLRIDKVIVHAIDDFQRSQGYAEDKYGFGHIEDVADLGFGREDLVLIARNRLRNIVHLVGH